MGYGGKDLQKRKVLSLEWKSEGVMDNESGELMELVEDVPSSIFFPVPSFTNSWTGREFHGRASAAAK